MICRKFAEKNRGELWWITEGVAKWANCIILSWKCQLLSWGIWVGIGLGQCLLLSTRGAWGGTLDPVLGTALPKRCGVFRERINNSTEGWKNVNCKRSLQGGCLIAKGAWNNLWVKKKSSTEMKEMTCYPSLQINTYKYRSRDAHQTFLGKPSWWQGEKDAGRDFLGKRSPPCKAFKNNLSMHLH